MFDYIIHFLMMPMIFPGVRQRPASFVEWNRVKYRTIARLTKWPGSEGPKQRGIDYLPKD